MRLVEFTGVPGSGKSTIISLVKKELKRQDVAIISLENLILRKVRTEPIIGNMVRVLPKKLGMKLAYFWYLLRKFKHLYHLHFCMSWPDLIAYYQGHNKKRNIPEKDKIELLDCFLETGGQYQMAVELCQEHEVFLLCEGFFHKIINLNLSVHEAVPDAATIHPYLQLIPQIDLLCEIKTSTAIAHKRVIHRGKPERFRLVEDNDFMAIIQKSQKIIENGLSVFGHEIIQIDNSTDFTSSKKFIQAIADRLREIDFKHLMMATSTEDRQAQCGGRPIHHQRQNNAHSSRSLS